MPYRIFSFTLLPRHLPGENAAESSRDTSESHDDKPGKSSVPWPPELAPIFLVASGLSVMALLALRVPFHFVLMKTRCINVVEMVVVIKGC